MSRIFIISNRVAVPSSDRAVHPGGLEVALRALLSRNKCVWMGWSGRAVDEAKDLEVHSSTSRSGTEYVVTDLLRQDYEEYYNGFANRVLWPVLHYRQDLAEFSRRDLSGYLARQHALRGSTVPAPQTRRRRLGARLPFDAAGAGTASAGPS